MVKNDLSDDVSSVFPKSKVLNIDCESLLQGMGYNEIKNKNNDVIKNYRNAKEQKSQLMTLINCINSSDKELSAKMDRYLESAALVVFISGGATKDVFSAFAKLQGP